MTDRDRFRGADVLLAEEDADYRGVLERLLRRQGARVTAIANWREVVRIARTAAFDLVVADLPVASRDGREGIGALRRASPQARIVVIMEDLAAGGIPVGSRDVDGVVLKPFTVERLLEVIQGVMGGGSQDRAPSLPAGKDRL